MVGDVVGVCMCLVFFCFVFLVQRGDGEGEQASPLVGLAQSRNERSCLASTAEQQQQ